MKGQKKEHKSDYTYVPCMSYDAESTTYTLTPAGIIGSTGRLPPKSHVTSLSQFMEAEGLLSIDPLAEAEMKSIVKANIIEEPYVVSYESAKDDKSLDRDSVVLKVFDSSARELTFTFATNTPQVDEAKVKMCSFESYGVFQLWELGVTIEAKTSLRMEINRLIKMYTYQNHESDYVIRVVPMQGTEGIDRLADFAQMLSSEILQSHFVEEGEAQKNGTENEKSENEAENKKEDEEGTKEEEEKEKLSQQQQMYIEEEDKTTSTTELIGKQCEVELRGGPGDVVVVADIGIAFRPDVQMRGMLFFLDRPPRCLSLQRIAASTLKRQNDLDISTIPDHLLHFLKI